MLNNIIKVILWGDEVGTLYWDAAKGCSVFSFNDRFVSKNLNVSPIVAPIVNGNVIRKSFLGNKDKVYQGLPEFLADSLPDHWGNLIFEQWAKQNNVSLRDLTPVDKLCFIGSRAMGAFEFQPETNIGTFDNQIQLDSLYKLARKIFLEREDVKIESDEPLTLQGLYEVGTSAGGKHPKAIIAIDKNTGDIRSGQVILPEDYEYYILKFAESDDFPFTNIEMTYYKMALAAGINIMPSKLISVEGREHFLTQRYDRIDGKKVFVQTLAAISPDASSYESLFEVARYIGVSSAEQAELFRRLVFNIFAGNVDDHQKNFSFSMDENGSWHITPAYDVTFTTNLNGPVYERVHTMSVCGKTNDITQDELLYFAKSNGIKNAKSIIEDVATSVSTFYKSAIDCGVSVYWADKIEEYLRIIMPAEYTSGMTNYIPSFIEPFVTENGVTVSDVKFHETERHDIVLYATINEVSRKHTFYKNSDQAAAISKYGANHIPEQMQKALIEEFLK